MKKLTLLLALAVLFAFKPKVEEIPNLAVLSGTIENPLEDFIIVSYIEAIETIRDTAKLDSAGSFIIDIGLNKPAYYTFHHGRETSAMFLSPGDSLKLTLNPDEFDETIKYEGKGSIINNYLAQSYLYNESLNVDYREIFKLDEIGFIAKIDSVYVAVKDNFEKFLEENEGLDDFFVNMERNKHLYKWAIQLNNYPSYHAYYAENDSFKVSDNYYDFYSKLNLNDSSLIELPEYINYLNGIVRNKTEEIYEKDSVLQEQKNGYNETTLKVIESEFTDPKIKEQLLYSLMTKQVKYYGVEDIDKMMEVFKKNCKNEAFMAKIEEEIVKWDKIAPGKAAPLFSYPDTEGNMVSLSDFLGKYVYIDVWATWCGPCRKEIPFMKELEKEFHGKNVVFMSVSVDKEADKEKWMNMIMEQEMVGVQLFADKDWKSSIAEDYMVNSIPRFLLIDREGKIITSRAERPSGKIKEVLAALEGI